MEAYEDGASRRAEASDLRLRDAAGEAVRFISPRVPVTTSAPDALPPSRLRLEVSRSGPVPVSVRRSRTAARASRWQGNRRAQVPTIPARPGSGKPAAAHREESQTAR